VSAAEQLQLWDEEPRPQLVVVRPDPRPRTEDGRIVKHRCRCCKVPIAAGLRCRFCMLTECGGACGPIYARLDR
jgi:hypothetical protein